MRSASNRPTSVPDHRRGNYRLEDYAEYTRLPRDFLKSHGVRGGGQWEWPRDGSRCVVIPFYDADGEEVAVLHRSGTKKRWPSGTSKIPYGLHRVGDTEPSEQVLLVEGASDCHALWFHGFTALGLPDSTTWRSEWAEPLRGRRLIAWKEPGESGNSFIDTLAPELPDLEMVPAPEGIKDPLELHRRYPETFEGRLRKLIENADPAEATTEEQESPFDPAAGFVPSPRDLYHPEHPWNPRNSGEEVTKRDALNDLIARARYAPGKGLERGEFQGSVRVFADDWNWGNGTTHNFLTELDQRGIIDWERSDTPGEPSLFRIVGYDRLTQGRNDTAERGTPRRDGQKPGYRERENTSPMNEELNEETSRLGAEVSPGGSGKSDDPSRAGKPPAVNEGLNVLKEGREEGAYDVGEEKKRKEPTAQSSGHNARRSTDTSQKGGRTSSACTANDHPEPLATAVEVLDLQPAEGDHE